MTIGPPEDEPTENDEPVEDPDPESGVKQGEKEAAEHPEGFGG